MSDFMKVSSNPHIRSKMSTQIIMLCVVIALLPTTVFGIYNFGQNALILVFYVLNIYLIYWYIKTLRSKMVRQL